MSQMVCPQRHVTWGDQEIVLSGKLRLYETWVGHKNVVTREIVSDAIGFFLLDVDYGLQPGLHFISV
jgi:hypothetical protein